MAAHRTTRAPGLAALLALVLCQCSPEPAPEAVAFETAPYLVDLGPDRATVCWRTGTAQAGHLRFGTTPDCRTGEVRTEAGLRHVAVLTRLRPDTVFHYRVGDRLASFRTHREQREAVFAAIGHTHGAEEFDHYPDALLLDLVREQAPDFAVHCGDATWTATPADFRRHWFGPFRDLLGTIPVYLAPGNHEAGWPFHRGVDLRVFRELFPFDYPEGARAVATEGCHGIVKAGIRFSFLSYVSDLRPDSAQLRWLGAELRAPADLHVVVLGGAQAKYWREGPLLDFLVENGCDLAIRGDGAEPGAPRGEHRGMPMYFVGSAGAGPHALLRFEWSSGRLRVARHRPTHREELLDEWAITDGRLWPSPGAPRLRRPPLPAPADGPRPATDLPVTLAVGVRAEDSAAGQALPERARGLGAAALAVSGEVRPPRDAIASGPGWHVRRLPGLLLLQVTPPLPAGPGPGLAAFAEGPLREFPGLRLCVVAGDLGALAAELALLQVLRSGAVDAVLMPQAPAGARGRLGAATVLRGGAGPWDLLAVEVHETHLCVKRIGADNSCAFVGWAYGADRAGAEPRPVDPASLRWERVEDAMARVPLDGRPVRGLGIRLAGEAGRRAATVRVATFPKELPPRQEGHDPPFEGFWTQGFRLDADDGAVRMPLVVGWPEDGAPFALGEVRLVITPAEMATSGAVVELFWY